MLQVPLKLELHANLFLQKYTRVNMTVLACLIVSKYQHEYTGTDRAFNLLWQIIKTPYRIRGKPSLRQARGETPETAV